MENATSTELWASNRGAVVCRRHGGAYSTAHLDSHPRAHRFVTPLDAWERVTEADRVAWIAEVGAPMRCEVCP